MADPHDGSQGTLSVGGPNGIRIDGAKVTIGGLPQAGRAVPAQMTAPLSGPQLVGELTQVRGLLARHGRWVATALWLGAGLVFTSAVTVIVAFHLSSVLLAVPTICASALVVAGGAIALHARKYRATEGVEPDVERRILDVALAYRGRVTVTAVARELAIPLAEADAVLSALARSGHVAVENDPTSGVVIYVFPDIDAGLVLRRS